METDGPVRARCKCVSRTRSRVAPDSSRGHSRHPRHRPSYRFGTLIGAGETLR
jgi:hypothetical protein